MIIWYVGESTSELISFTAIINLKICLQRIIAGVSTGHCVCAKNVSNEWQPYVVLSDYRESTNKVHSTQITEQLYVHYMQDFKSGPSSNLEATNCLKGTCQNNGTM